MKTFKNRTLFAVLLLLVGALTTAYGQDTPTDDAYTNTGAPSTNYGTATTLGVVSASETAYIRFDLSSIPAGYTSANVAKASLKLYVNAVTTAGSFNVDFVNGAWTEKTITANMAPALGSTVAASVPLGKANAHDYIIVDVTSAVGAWLNGTQANDGIALVANSPLSATFDSKENTGQSHPAELDIVFNGAITGITTVSGTGLTGGGTSGTLNLSLLNTCATNQILQWNGSAWVCSKAGTGTVTSVGLSAPSSDFTVSGSPITKSGTLGLNWTVAPTSSDTANAIVKRDGTGSFSATSIAAVNLTATNPTGVAIFASTAAPNGAITGSNTGTSAVADGVDGVTSSAAASGVAGINNGGGVGVYAAGGTGVFGTGSNFGFQTDTNVQQARSAGGWVKAMAYVQGMNAPYSIVRCFNSTLSGAAATTPPCGINFLEGALGIGHWTLDFGFEVDDRFYSATIGEQYDIRTTIVAAAATSSDPNKVYVDTVDSSGNGKGNYFTLIVF